MLQKSSSVVLAALKASTYQPRTPWPFARCGLAGRTFHHPLGFYVVRSSRDQDASYFRSASFATVSKCARIRCVPNRGQSSWRLHGWEKFGNMHF